MASERLLREEQFHSKNCLLKFSRFHAKMRLKSAPQKTQSYIKKLCNRLQLQMPLHVPAELHTVTQPHFQ